MLCDPMKHGPTYCNVLLFHVLGSNRNDEGAAKRGKVSPGVGIKFDKVGMLAGKDPVLESIGIKLSSFTSDLLRLAIVEPGDLVLSLFNDVFVLNVTEAESVLVDLSNAIKVLLISGVARVENEGNVGKTAELGDRVVVLKLGNGGPLERNSWVSMLHQRLESENEDCW